MSHAKRSFSDMYDVKPIKIDQSEEDSKPILGRELFPYKYGSIVLNGKTGFGKTTIINHILERTIDERTKVWIFCSTVELDHAWKKIIKDLERRDIQVHAFPHLKDPQTGKSMLQPLLNELHEERIARDTMKEVTPEMCQEDFHCWINWHQRKEEAPKKKYPTQVCENIIILDDLDINELKDPSVQNAIKKNRHYQSRMIISTQHMIHMAKNVWEQVFMICLYPGIAQDYIVMLRQRLGGLGKMTSDEFVDLYEQATRGERDFLTIYPRERGEWDQFRQNFYPHSIQSLAY